MGPGLASEFRESLSKNPYYQGKSLQKARTQPYAQSTRRQRQRLVHPGTTAALLCVQQFSVALKTTNNQPRRFFPAKPHVLFSLQVALVQFECSSSLPPLEESSWQPDQDGIFHLLAAQLQSPPILHLTGLQSSQSIELLVG